MQPRYTLVIDRFEVDCDAWSEVLTTVLRLAAHRASCEVTIHGALPNSAQLASLKHAVSVARQKAVA